jgi:hypothetical protein
MAERLFVRLEDEPVYAPETKVDLTPEQFRRCALSGSSKTSG